MQHSPTGGWGMTPDEKSAAIKFDCLELLKAVESFHVADTGAARYRQMIEDGRPYNLDLVVPVLTSWKAHRGTGDAAMLRNVLSRFVTDRRDELDHLRSSQLSTLSDEDLNSVRSLVGFLESQGFKPTSWGKSLHMLAPNAILLWDREVIRGRYGLSGDVDGFLSYQRFGRRLAKSLGTDLVKVPEQHAAVAGYIESIPKILDELAYQWDGSARAVLSLGGHSAAFA
jgi:hypothetical protein